MASVTVLPNADGTGMTNWSIFGGPSSRYGAVNNGVSTPDDTDYIRQYISEGGGPFSGFMGWEDMPVDFDVITAVSLKIRQRATITQDGFQVRIFKSDESTALTSNITWTESSMTGSFANYTKVFTITGDTDKTSWDGAVIKLTHDGPGDGDDPQWDISEMELDITYTEREVVDAKLGKFMLFLDI